MFFRSVVGNPIICECLQTAATYLGCAHTLTASGGRPLEKHCRAELSSDGSRSPSTPTDRDFRDYWDAPESRPASM